MQSLGRGYSTDLLTPYADRRQEDRLLQVIARMDGTSFPTAARLTGR
jgi:hypothetical protein